MSVKVQKVQTAFRLDGNLLDRMKLKAKKENRSLNNFVETVFMQMFYNVPNKETTEAIEEARSGKIAGIANTKDLQSFIESCSK